MSTAKDDLIRRADEVIGMLRTENAQLTMELENATVQLRGPAAPVLDCVGYLTIKHHANGGLQVSGNIGDLKYALDMLEHAKDSVRAHHLKPAGPTLLAADGNPMVSIPNRDVDLESKLPQRPFGDMRAGERGDLPPS
jgi:hypothetical protein